MPNNKENILPYTWQKGQSGNPKGRPRKYVCLLKDYGYNISEINDTIQTMMAMDMKELKEVWDNPDATILEKTIAGAMRKSLDKGSLYSLETLLSRVYGKPKEQTELSGSLTINKVEVEIYQPNYIDNVNTSS
tara:strand:+ start:917 stop:1315 length:399 start_codon:yes stop_codon:yes gene_type:complete